MRELFAYYRLSSNDAAAAKLAVARFQAQLRLRYPSLRTRLLCRQDEGGGEQTWMETYSTDPMREPRGVDADMQVAIEAHACVLEPWLRGVRHLEVFFACA